MANGIYMLYVTYCELVLPRYGNFSCHVMAKCVMIFMIHYCYSHNGRIEAIANELNKFHKRNLSYTM